MEWIKLRRISLLHAVDSDGGGEEERNVSPSERTTRSASGRVGSASRGRITTTAEVGRGRPLGAAKVIGRLRSAGKNE